ncbi:MAG: DUF751 family protein [Symploca sp. SIO3C6]|uniref:DUF751 family protein n=1 Tax=Symploca sp. SIO1C4 TaxID=2607765 RepID=A0A6B3NAG4_9CYAN|nr:DUF751 family protein [Symploca sp. SIO3C6]NER26621.1 DUF751 family protein [Symploca sp. SIO1C4]
MFDGFWENVLRYPRYLISFSLGVFYSVFSLFKPLLERPVSAIAFIGLLMAGFFFITFTLRAMLGLGLT